MFAGKKVTYLTIPFLSSYFLPSTFAAKVGAIQADVGNFGSYSAFLDHSMSNIQCSSQTFRCNIAHAFLLVQRIVLCACNIAICFKLGLGVDAFIVLVRLQVDTAHLQSMQCTLHNGHPYVTFGLLVQRK